MTPAVEREAVRRAAGLGSGARRFLLAATRRPKRIMVLRRHAKLGPQAPGPTGLNGLLDWSAAGVALSPLGVLVKRAAGGRG